MDGQTSGPQHPQCLVDSPLGITLDMFQDLITDNVVKRAIRIGQR
jgi:hypothetical protein